MFVTYSGGLGLQTMPQYQSWGGYNLSPYDPYSQQQLFYQQQAATTYYPAISLPVPVALQPPAAAVEESKEPSEFTWLRKRVEEFLWK
jgi:hypothetical protein